MKRRTETVWYKTHNNYIFLIKFVRKKRMQRNIECMGMRCQFDKHEIGLKENISFENE